MSSLHLSSLCVLLFKGRTPCCDYEKRLLPTKLSEVPKMLISQGELKFHVLEV